MASQYAFIHISKQMMMLQLWSIDRTGGVEACLLHAFSGTTPHVFDPAEAGKGLSRQFVRFLFIFTFSLCHSIANTQPIHGITIDIQSWKPVPYTTIKILNAPLGVVADSTGHYILRHDSVKKVLFTSIGYRDTIISSLAIGDTTFLTPSPKALATVVIRTWKPGKTYIVGNGASLIGKLTRCDSKTAGFVYSVNKATSCVQWGRAALLNGLKKLYCPIAQRHFS